MLTAMHPLTPARFGDVERVFAAKGCSFARGCWCMAYRETGRPAVPPGRTVADARRGALLALAGITPAPGLIGYVGDEPAGWVAVGPRVAFARMQRSPVMRPVDERPAWAAVCFVVPGPWRRRGMAGALLAAAVGHARAHGAKRIEGVPIDRPEGSQPQWLWHGTAGMFARAGFVEVARRKPGRPVMRLEL